MKLFVNILLTPLTLILLVITFFIVIIVSEHDEWPWSIYKDMYNETLRAIRNRF